MGAILARLSSRLATPGLIDRGTGQYTLESCPLPDALRLTLLYKTWIGRLLLSLPLTWWILSWQHHRVARYANSPKSKKAIPSFIKTYAIDASAAEHPVESYPTLQAFFARRLKPGMRPLAAPEYFLEPQSRREDESVDEFAARVQAMIAKQAKLRVVPWDGYLKYYNLGEKHPGLIEKRRKVFADQLKTFLPAGGAVGSSKQEAAPAAAAAAAAAAAGKKGSKKAN